MRLFFVSLTLFNRLYLKYFNREISEIEGMYLQHTFIKLTNKNNSDNFP